MAASGSSPAKVFVSHAARESEVARGLADALSGILRLARGDLQMTSSAESSLVASGIRDRHSPALDARVLIIVATASNPAGGGELLTHAAAGAPSSASAQSFRVVLGSSDVDPAALPAEVSALPFVSGADELALEDLIGQLAGELGVATTLDMGAHRKQLYRVASALRGERAKPGAGRVVRYGMLGAAVIAATAGAAVALSRLDAPNPTDRFGFERDADGWVALGADDGGGCVAVRRSDEEAKTGDYALELDMVLDPLRESRRSGEGAWDARVAGAAKSGASPAGPVDLRGKEVSLWVYATSGAEGERESPNGIQLFVKDGGWHSQYSSWANVEPERWVRLSMTVGERTSGGYMDSELDGSAIRLIGVKISLGERSQMPFEGPVFVDAVTW